METKIYLFLLKSARHEGRNTLSETKARKLFMGAVYRRLHIN